MNALNTSETERYLYNFNILDIAHLITFPENAEHVIYENAKKRGDNYLVVSTSRRGNNRLITPLLQCGELLQYMNKTKRKKTQHVSYEDNPFTIAFNMELTFAGLMELLAKGMINRDAANVTQLQQIFGLIISSLEACFDRENSLNSKKTNLFINPDIVSIHIPLHRLLSKLIAEATIKWQLNVPNLLKFDNEDNRDKFVNMLMCSPVRNFVFAADVMVGKWVRNGNFNYSAFYLRSNIGANMIHLDIAALQIAAALEAAQKKHEEKEDENEKKNNYDKEYFMKFLLKTFRLLKFFDLSVDDPKMEILKTKTAKIFKPKVISKNIVTKKSNQSRRRRGRRRFIWQ